jgi:hypothetical protein
MHARYFAREELFETLSSLPIGKNRTAFYNYKHGATYEG